MFVFFCSIYFLDWVLCVAGVLTIALNLLVLITITFRKRNLMVIEIYIVNMAICDFLHGVLGFPMLVTAFFHHGWPLGLHGKY